MEGTGRKSVIIGVLKTPKESLFQERERANGTRRATAIRPVADLGGDRFAGNDTVRFSEDKR